MSVGNNFVPNGVLIERYYRNQAAARPAAENKRTCALKPQSVWLSQNRQTSFANSQAP